MFCDMNSRILIYDLFESSLGSCLHFIKVISNKYPCFLFV